MRCFLVKPRDDCDETILSELGNRALQSLITDHQSLCRHRGGVGRVPGAGRVLGVGLGLVVGGGVGVNVGVAGGVGGAVGVTGGVGVALAGGVCVGDGVGSFNTRTFVLL